MRKDKIIAIIGVVCLLPGCSLSHWGGKETPREIEEKENSYVWKEMYKVESTLWPLEDKVAAIETEKTAAMEKLAEMDHRMNAMQEELATLEMGKAAAMEKLAEMNHKMNAIREELAILNGLSLQSNFRIDAVQDDIKRLRNDSNRKNELSTGVIGSAPQTPRQSIVSIPLAAESQKAPSPTVRSIMITDIQYQGTDTQDKVLVHLTAMNNPKMQRLVNPPRIVLDFLNTGNYGKESYEIDADGIFLERIRIKTFKEPGEKVRLVLDMTMNKKYVVDQKFSSKENIYSIVIRDSKN